MNVTDLGAELQARAIQVPAAAAATRIAGVRGRIRARRRRQAGAFATVAVACLVAVGFLPIAGDLLANRSQPPASHSKAKSADRYVFDDVLAGDPLITSAVGKRGQRDIQVVFTPLDTNLTISAFCDIRDTPDRVTEHLTGQVTINGHESLGAGCLSDTSANSVSGGPAGDTPTERRASLARLGVLPGKPSVLRITLVSNDGQVEFNREVLLGVGLYELSAPRLTTDGVIIPKLAESYPHDYELVSYRTARITKTTRSLTLDLPQAKVSGWVTGGNVTAHEGYAAGTTKITFGKDGGSSQVPDGGSASGPIGAAATTIKVEVSPGSTGTMMLACYRQVD